MRFLSRCTLRCPLLPVVRIQLDWIDVVTGKASWATQRGARRCGRTNNLMRTMHKLRCLLSTQVCEPTWFNGIDRCSWTNLNEKDRAFGEWTSIEEILHLRYGSIDHRDRRRIRCAVDRVSAVARSNNGHHENPEWSSFLNESIVFILSATARREQRPINLIEIHRELSLCRCGAWEKRLSNFQRNDEESPTEELSAWWFVVKKPHYDYHRQSRLSDVFSVDNENWSF